MKELGNKPEARWGDGPMGLREGKCHLFSFPSCHHDPALLKFLLRKQATADEANITRGHLANKSKTCNVRTEFCRAYYKATFYPGILILDLCLPSEKVLRRKGLKNIYFSSIKIKKGIRTKIACILHSKIILSIACSYITIYCNFIYVR